MNPNPALIPVQSAPKITNAQVEQLLAMRDAQKGLKERLRLMEESVDKIEKDLIAAVASGADLSQCGYEVSLQTVERRYPAWKEHFISKLGKEAADAVMNSTAPTTFQRVVIK